MAFNCKKIIFINNKLYLRLFLIVLSCFYLSSLTHCLDNDKCIGLVLSSGGSRGSYHAGALKGLIDTLPPEDTHWDIVSGVSAGAINTLSALLFNIGEEKKWADYLIQMWSTIKKSDVYSEWTFREIEGLLIKSGIYNNLPLKKYLNNTIEVATNGTNKFYTDRKIIVSATKMIDGSQVSWSEKTPSDTLIQAVVASSTISGIFPVAIVEDTEFTDGSVFAAINILSVINRCIEEKKVKPSEIIIDMLLCTPIDLNDSFMTFSDQNSLNILLRASYLSTYSNTKLMIERAKLLFPEVQFRHIVAPNETIQNMGLDFESKSLIRVIDQGYQDGVKVASEYLMNLFKNRIKIFDF